MKRVIVFLVTAVFFGFINITGQGKEVVLSENSVESFAQGIKSNNIGLKKSAISLVGQYKLKQICPILIQQFSDETDVSYKLMIAEMIYSVGCPESIESFRAVLKDETIDELQYFCKMLHENYLFANNL